MISVEKIIKKFSTESSIWNDISFQLRARAIVKVGIHGNLDGPLKRSFINYLNGPFNTKLQRIDCNERKF